MRIIGSGGGKDGGGGGGIQEDPDTLSSVAFASFVEVLGEGPIVGLVNGEYSIYVDGVPLRDLIGTPNYRPFNWDFRTGTQTQEVIPGFTGTQSSIDVGLRFQKSQGQIVRDVPDTYADAVRVTIAVNGLSQTTDKGEIQGTSVDFKIGIRRTAGAWQWSQVFTISGKTGARYQSSYELNLSNLGAGPYQVSVIRVTDDSTSSLLVNATYWDYYTVINYEQYTYPNTALAAVQLDARYFSNIPSRSYHVRGLYLQVPKNYDPGSRVYETTGPGTTNGAWNGQFKTAYTNNPAWVFYELLTNTRWGLGQRIPPELVNKWELYEIAKYCDEFVPTGLNLSDFSAVSGGGFDVNGIPIPSIPLTKDNAEPRFTLNAVINTQDDAYKVLSQVSSVFRGMAYWGGGMATVTQDRPADPSFLLNNSNVKGGTFRYSGTSRAQRRTCAVVQWNDPEEGFRPKYEYVQDLDGVKKYGVSTENLVSFGSTSRWQARRTGLWFLITERYETEAVECSVGQDFAFVMPGDIGEIMDSNKSGVRWGGRVLANCTTTQINLDAEISLAAGTYTVYVKMPDNTVHSGSAVIETSGVTQSITLTAAMPSAPAPGAMWLINSGAVTSRRVRVVSKAMDGPTGYGLFMVTHNPSKYPAVDRGAAVKEFDYSYLDMDTVDAVKNLTASEQSFKPFVGAPTKTNVLISYDSVGSPLHKGFYVKLSKVGTVFEQPLTSDCSVQFEDVPPGVYDITVRAVNQFNKVGPDAVIPITVTGIDSVKPAQVSNFRYELDGSNGVRLLWDTLQDYIDAYEVKEGLDWDSGVLVAESKSDRLAPIQMKSGSHRFWIKARDTSLNYSDVATSLSVDLQVITTPALESSFSEGQAVIAWNPVTSILPIVSYEFRYGGTSWETATVFGETRGSPLNVVVTWVDERTFWCKARDTADNYSAAGSLTISVSKPLAPTALSSTFADTDAILNWTKVAGPLPIREFEITQGADYATSVFVDRCSGTSYRTPATWLAGPSNARKFWITQIDSNGQVGTPASLSVTIVAPAAPSTSGTFSGTNYGLQWTPGAGSLRVDEFIIRQGGTSFDTATEVARVKASSYAALASWVGARIFRIAAKDCAGNIGAASATTLTVTAPPAPSVTTKVTPNYAAEVSWTAAQATLPLASYEVSWTAQDGSTTTVRTSSNIITTDINWTGNKVFTVKSVDTGGNLGAGGTSTLVITVPAAPVVVSPAEQTQTEFVIRWTCAQGSLPLKEFDVRHGSSFASGTLVGTLSAFTITVKGAWTGNRIYWVRAKDIAGNVSAVGSVTISITPPIAPVVGSSVIDNNVLLRWSDSKQTMPIDTYSVYRAANQVPFAQSLLIGTLSGLFTTVFENTRGYYDYYITATDSAGNTSPAGKVTTYISQPPDYQIQLDRDSDFNGVNYEFSANGNPEGWTITGGTQSVVNGINTITSTGTDPNFLRNMQDQFFYGCEHPILLMKIRRVSGSGWQGDVYYSTVGGHGLSESWKKTRALSLVVGDSAVVAWDMRLNNAGNDDWMASRIDTLRFDLGAAADDVFQIDWIRLVPWVGTNILLEEDNTLSLPVDTTESYSGHFTTRSWTTPQAQVTAGYTRFIQPVPLTASYEEIIDYGAVLPGTQIQVTPTANVVMGTLTELMRISVKKLWTDAWVTTNNTTNIYASDFRYIKVTVTYTGVGNDDMISLQKLNVKLALKIRTDSGSARTGGPVRVQGNLVDYSGLAAGNTLPSGWVRRTAAETSVALRAAPNAAFPQELCVVSMNVDATSNEDGGFSTPNITLDVNSDYIFACFVKRLTNNGISRLETSPNAVLTLAGAVSPSNGFVSTKLPNANQWYLLVGYLHNVGYGTVDTGFSGIYDLSGTKVSAGVEYKFRSGFPSLYLGCLHRNNTVDTAVDTQHMLRPVIIKADPASFTDKLNYIINCATKDGVFVPFTQSPIDVSSVSVNVLGSKPLIPMYDFYDIPYPKGMNVFVFDGTGAFVAADVSWSINGTW